MGLPPTFSGINGPRLLRGLAFMLMAVGLGVWAALLFAPVSQDLPPALDTAPFSGQDTGPVSNWFGGPALRVPISLAGVIFTEGGRGAALLSINGTTAQAYRVGQSLAPGVTLSGVSAQGVSIDQDGVIEQLTMPANPADVVQGFVPVTKSTKLTQP
ncbi:type II secretion system protein N [Pollutimonas harenae]|uniref:Type II secretion system protein GspC N-terminal domain-containing protein n=1 Tax=Pollutimonas harenae TaxID=657015 RepID=A0A853H7F5_9BURK|nr:type II secretion system protein N [Pollutimonas harenae]NYT86014.1 hypothetical protein [Pollutimonas harenae]TEA71062.1 hypothetical protein ERD84_10465 [Pollutimonas harenae]